MKALYFTIPLLLSMSAAVQASVDHNASVQPEHIIYKVNGKKVNTLRGNVSQGATVEVSFVLAQGAEPGRLSLVSYTAPGSSFDPNTAAEQQVYDEETGVFKEGKYTLAVQVPKGYFQVDFIKGEAIRQLGPAGSNNFYSAQKRLISADNGGNAPAADEERITVCHHLAAASSAEEDIVIAASALSRHEAAGDHSGSCHRKAAMLQHTKPDICQSNVAEATEAPAPVRKVASIIELGWSRPEDIQEDPQPENSLSLMKPSADESNNGENIETGGPYSADKKTLLNCYRPRQYDFSGTYTYFNLIKLRISTSQANTEATPNPTSDNRIHIVYGDKSTPKPTFAIQIRNNEGKIVLMNKFSPSEDQASADLDMPENILQPGTYVLEVETPSQTYRQKIYKQ